MPPVNNERANAIQIPSLPHTLAGSNLDAATFSGDLRRNSSIHHSVWYLIGPFASNTNVILTLIGDFRCDITIWRTNDGLTQISPNTTFFYFSGAPHSGQVSQPRFVAQAGQQYFVQVNGYGSGQMGSFSLLAETYTAPVNDMRANPEIVALPAAIAASNKLATREGTEPGGTFAQTTVWYEFEVTELSWITFVWGAVDGFFQGYLNVYPKGSSTAVISHITIAPRTSEASFEPGEYEIQFGTYASAATAIVGDFSINATAEGITRPPNDLVGDAIPITSIPYSTTQSTKGATRDATEPVANNAVRPTVWYTITLQQDTLVEINTFGSDHSTSIVIWSHDLTSVLAYATNSDVESNRAQVFFEAKAGVTYFIQTGGTNGAMGQLNLNVDGAVRFQPEDPVTVIAMSDWTYENTCDPAFASYFDSTWSWYVSYHGDDSYFTQGKDYVEVYYELYTHSVLGRIMLIWHFTDSSWSEASIICPTVTEDPLIIDPFYPQGPKGAWSDWYPGYVREWIASSMISTSTGIAYNETQAHHVLPSNQYVESIDYATWAKVIGYNVGDAGERDWRGTGIGVGGDHHKWINGAFRSMEGEFYHWSMYHTLAVYTENWVWRTREIWPENVVPELEWGVDYHPIPGSFFFGSYQYMQHDPNELPYAEAAGVEYRFFGVTAIENDLAPPMLPRDVHFTLEHDPTRTQPFDSSFNEQIRPASPDGDVKITFTTGQPGDWSTRYWEIVSGPIEETEPQDINKRSTVRVTLSFHVDEINTVLAESNHLQSSQKPNTNARLSFKSFVDAHHAITLAPPPWGGTAASWFSWPGMSHEMQVRGNPYPWHKIHWQRWRVWNPHADSEVEVPCIPMDLVVRFISRQHRISEGRLLSSEQKRTFYA